MTTDLEHLAAESEIRAVLARYARGVDRADLDLVRSCYHPDATDDHGGYSGPLDGFIDWLPGQLQRFEWTRHHLGNQLISIDGDHAGVETYCEARHRLRDRAADSVAGVRYLDRFERRAGSWRIARRQVVVDWHFVQELRGTDVAEGYAMGRRGRDDPSYEFGLE